MRQLDPQQALTRIETLEEGCPTRTAPQRFNLQLIGPVFRRGLGLAMLGIYAVVAESVAQRVPKIGVRMALGARGSDVVRMILGQGIWMVVIGIGLGAVGAVHGTASCPVWFRRPDTDPASYIACRRVSD